jgi:hypothetical protein
MAQSLMGLQDLLGQSNNASSGGLLGGGVFSQPESRGQRRSRLLTEAISDAGQNPYARLGASFGGLIGMGGRAAAEGLGIVDAPAEVQEAEAIRQVQQEVAEQGLDPMANPREFGQYVSSRFQELGQPQLATRSLLQAKQLESQFAPEPQERTINAIGGTPLANQLSRIHGVNIPEGQSYEISMTGNRVTDINSLGAQTNVSQTVEGQQQRSPFMERMDEVSADQAAERTEAGTVARNLRQTLVDIEDTITSPGLETGAVQPLITPIQALAESVNVNLTEIADRAGIPLGDLETKEEFNRLSNILTTEMFSKFKGNLNDREVRIAQESVTNLGASPEANRKAVASLLASAEIADEYATRVSQVKNREEYLALEKEKTERGAEEFKRRRDEISERLNRKTYINKANQAINNGAADVRRYVEAANAEELDALPEETRQNIANILGGS